MSEFREKLVALGRGQTTVSDVKNALRTQVATAPEKISEAQQLLDAALKAGMPETVYTNLTQVLPVQEDPDTTLFSGSDWAKTEVLMPDVDDASSDRTEMDIGDATIMSNGSLLIDADASAAIDLGEEADGGATLMRLDEEVDEAERDLSIPGGGIVARGGSFTDPLGRCKISLSEKHSGKADPVTGFRLVRELS